MLHVVCGMALATAAPIGSGLLLPTAMPQTTYSVAQPPDPIVSAAWQQQQTRSDREVEQRCKLSAAWLCQNGSSYANTLYTLSC